jgi:hypothetical protein
VRIPLIPARMKILFSLWTDDQNNRKACQQLSGINERRRNILEDTLVQISVVAVARPGACPGA